MKPSTTKCSECSKRTSIVYFRSIMCGKCDDGSLEFDTTHYFCGICAGVMGMLSKNQDELYKIHELSHHTSIDLV